MQIVECVTVNLTCVYALMAYSSVKQKDFSNIYVSVCINSQTLMGMLSYQEGSPVYLLDDPYLLDNS